MLSRRTMLFVSFVTALALYSGLYALSPNIFLLRVNSAAARLPEAIRVKLLDGFAAPRFEAVVDETATMASRPGSVRDLLERETENLPLAETAFEDPADEEPLAERVARNGIEREYELTPDDETAAGIEARILEISEDVARSEIEIARRFVRPSAGRLIERGEMMGAGGAGRERGGEKLRLGALPASVSGAGVSGRPSSREQGLSTAPKIGAPTEGTLQQDAGLSSLPALPDETLLSGEFARRAVQRESAFEQLDDLVELRAETYVDPATDTGYFRLRISPADEAGLTILQKDVTFVVDASNSILQRKLDLTVRGLKDCLAQLREGDRFNIVVFRDTHQSFREGLTEVTPAEIEDAIDFLERAKSGGSTDVYSAVEPVIAVPPRPGLPGVVVVVSDGRPSSGNLAGRDLINALTARNVHGNTIFTFGGGNTVNRYLMDLLAYRNRGMSVIAPRVEDIDEHLPIFFRRISDAILVDLRADYGRIDEESIFPRTLPDFYRGRAIIVYGQYEPGQDRELVLRLEGRAGGVKKDMVLRASLDNAMQGDRGIAQGWAFQKSYHLIGEMTRVGETPELIQELRRLSSEFDVRTSYFP